MSPDPPLRPERRVLGRWALLPVLLLLPAGGGLDAHQADTSYLRCRIADRAVELRFTLDLATLFRLARPDADGDGSVSRGEMEAVAPAVCDYLGRFVSFEVNGQPQRLHTRDARVWPADAGSAIPAKEYHQRLLHFSFRVDSRAPIEECYVLYDVFEELGEQHRVIADFEQDGRHHEVVFTAVEPDYVYDTFRAQQPRETLRAVIASAWGSAAMLLVLIPPAFRLRSSLGRAVACVRAGALGWLTWDLHREFATAPWLLLFPGIAVAAILGCLVFWSPVLVLIGRARKLPGG